MWFPFGLIIKGSPIIQLAAQMAGELFDFFQNTTSISARLQCKGFSSRYTLDFISSKKLQAKAVLKMQSKKLQIVLVFRIAQCSTDLLRKLKKTIYTACSIYLYMLILKKSSFLEN